MRPLFVVALLVTLAAAACKKPEPPARPAGGAAAQPAAAAAIRGKVLERIDAEPYSYLRLQTAGGEVWAAVPKADVKNGAEVGLMGPMPMDGFESKTLKRKFDKIYFATLAGQAPQGAPGAAAGMPPPGMPPAAGDGAPPSPAEMAARHAAAASGPADVGEVKVAKAHGADARTIAEVYAQRTALKQKQVSVRGKVVKFLPGIMGKNWLHLRDGTGDKSSNDLTVTTGDTVNVGDVVVAKGTVQVDKDFGAGYAYPVIVEDAKVAK